MVGGKEFDEGKRGGGGGGGIGHATPGLNGNYFFIFVSRVGASFLVLSDLQFKVSISINRSPS